MASRHMAFFAFLAFLLVTPSSTMSYEEVVITGGGTVTGTVKFLGRAAPPKKISVTRDKEVCGKEEKFSESLIVGSNGGVQNAVIFLADIAKGKKFDTVELQIDQRGCQFRPHVLVVPAGKSFDLINSDGILHNFRTTSTKNPILNKAQPRFKRKLQIKIDQPEIIRVNCDVHEWMHAWVVVTNHPYYTLTDANGDFKITSVPSGSYTLKLWHESLGEQTRKVTVRENEETKVTFEGKSR